jgi:hypothetical protein
MLDDFGRAFQAAALADARDILPIPFQAKLEILVGIQAGGIDWEYCHNRNLLYACNIC